MWTYDLNLYTFSYLTKGDVPELYAMRGCAMAVLVPVFALGAHRNASWKLRLSRTITFQSLSLVAIGAYLIAMVVIAVAAQALGGDYARVVQISFVFVMLVGALVLLPSGKFRAWRSEEHTSELQSLMRISYAVFCLKKKKTSTQYTYAVHTHVQ